MFARISAFIVLASTLACGDSSSSDDGSTTAEPSTSDGAPTSGTDDGTTGLDPAQLYNCKEEGFGASPLAGPLFDAEKGGIQGELQASYVLHTTQIYVKPEGGQAFYDMAQAISAEALKTEGLIAFSVGSDMGCGVARTMGIWASEEAMYKLVASEVHAKAMAATLDVSYTGRVTHWNATAAEANAYTWDVTYAKLAEVEPSGLY